MLTSESLLLSVRFLFICKSQEIIGGSPVVLSKLNQRLGRNVPPSNFVVRIGGLSTVKHLRNVRLG